MNIILLILAAIFALWMAWNVIEVAYRIVMIALCTIAYIFLTICEWTQFLVTWIVIKPAKALLGLARRNA